MNWGYLDHFNHIGVTKLFLDSILEREKFQTNKSVILGANGFKYTNSDGHEVTMGYFCEPKTKGLYLFLE